MLKPFFKPFFGSSLPTRLGKIIGKSNERVMLSGVDGPDGIRKKFRRNPDGSVTMLKTRAGMPQFVPDPSGGGDIGGGGDEVTFTVADVHSSSVTLPYPTFKQNDHLVTISATFSSVRIYPYLLDITMSPFYLNGYSSIQATGCSDGVTLISGSRIKVPAGVSEFYLSTTRVYNYRLPPFDVPGTAHLFSYTLFVGDDGAFGYGYGS